MIFSRARAKYLICQFSAQYSWDSLYPVFDIAEFDCTVKMKSLL